MKLPARWTLRALLALVALVAVVVSAEAKARRRAALNQQIAALATEEARFLASARQLDRFPGWCGNARQDAAILRSAALGCRCERQECERQLAETW